VRPTFEPRSGAAKVDGREGAEVLAKVEQDVDEGEPHFAGRRESAGMIALAPDWSVPVAGAVDGAGATDGETLQAADQRQGRV
jgi:hypothetical protein